MSLVAHAEKELRLAGMFDKDSDYSGAIGESVMELIKVFAEQGHSGMSAATTLAVFRKVAAYGVLAPLTGEDDEWVEVSEGVLQNKRNSAVFKNKESGKCHYLEAITWKTQKGTTWGGSADGISSSQNIKSFPFTPKNFTVDVIEEEVVKDGWEFHIKDSKSLDPVKEYYDFTQPQLRECSNEG